jgi:hypothetical protein
VCVDKETSECETGLDDDGAGGQEHHPGGGVSLPGTVAFAAALAANWTNPVYTAVRFVFVPGWQGIPSKICCAEKEGRTYEGDVEDGVDLPRENERRRAGLVHQIRHRRDARKEAGVGRVGLIHEPGRL